MGCVLTWFFSRKEEKYTYIRILIVYIQCFVSWVCNFISWDELKESPLNIYGMIPFIPQYHFHDITNISNVSEKKIPYLSGILIYIILDLLICEWYIWYFLTHIMINKFNSLNWETAIIIYIWNKLEILLWVKLYR